MLGPTFHRLTQTLRSPPLNTLSAWDVSVPHHSTAGTLGVGPGMVTQLAGQLDVASQFGDEFFGADHPDAGDLIELGHAGGEGGDQDLDLCASMRSSMRRAKNARDGCGSARSTSR